MLLSLSHNFLFVHVPKTAGSSLHDALLPYARPDTRSVPRRLLRWLPIVEAPGRAHFRIHAPASEIRAKLSPGVYDRFLSFAVVRNPFDHAVSHYEYMKQYRSARIARRFAAMSFADYLRFRLAPRRPWDRLFARMPDQSYFLADRRGRLLVNRLLRFETISDDFRGLADELGLASRDLPAVNRTEARSAKRPYVSYYDAETETLARRLYARDLALLGYDKALHA